MSKVVAEHYPASRLPEELRRGIDPAQHVTVTVTAEDDAPAFKPLTLDEVFAARRPPYLSAAEIDDRIRKLRDEWHD